MICSRVLINNIEVVQLWTRFCAIYTDFTYQAYEHDSFTLLYSNMSHMDETRVRMAPYSIPSSGKREMLMKIEKAEKRRGYILPDALGEPHCLVSVDTPNTFKRCSELCFLAVTVRTLVNHLQYVAMSSITGCSLSTIVCHPTREGNMCDVDITVTCCRSILR